jgi:hypothetical protein
MNPSISNTVILNPLKATSSSSTTLLPATASLETTMSNGIVTSPDALLSTPSSASSLTPYPSLDPSAPIALPEEVLKATLPPNTPLDPEIVFKLKLLEILTRLLSSDFALLQNILERTKKIIVHCSDLEDLIKILTGALNVTIMASPVTSGCCSSAGKLFYYNIDRIVVDGYDLQIKYNYAYNVLLSNAISFDNVICDSAL